MVSLLLATVNLSVEQWNGPATHYPSVSIPVSYGRTMSNILNVGVDYPYITTLLPDNSILIHNLDGQTLVQTIPAGPAEEHKRKFVRTFNGFLVPSLQESKKLQKVAVPLRRRPPPEPTTEGIGLEVAVIGVDVPPFDLES